MRGRVATAALCRRFSADPPLPRPPTSVPSGTSQSTGSDGLVLATQHRAIHVPNKGKASASSGSRFQSRINLRTSTVPQPRPKKNCTGGVASASITGEHCQVDGCTKDVNYELRRIQHRLSRSHENPKSYCYEHHWEAYGEGGREAVKQASALRAKRTKNTPDPCAITACEVPRRPPGIYCKAHRSTIRSSPRGKSLKRIPTVRQCMGDSDICCHKKANYKYYSLYKTTKVAIIRSDIAGTGLFGCLRRMG
jgi:hypothetical protein